MVDTNENDKTAKELDKEHNVTRTHGGLEIPLEFLITADDERHMFNSDTRVHRYDRDNPIEGPKLIELAANVTERGIIVKPLVRRHPKFKGFFEVADGNRRIVAARLAKENGASIEKIECDFRPMTDAEFADAYIAANYNRKDNDPITEAEAMDHARKFLGWSDERIAREFGNKKIGQVRRLIGPKGLLYGTAAVKKAVASGKLTVGQALQITYLDAGAQDEKLGGYLTGSQKHESSPGEKNLTNGTRFILLRLIQKVRSTNGPLFASVTDSNGAKVSPEHWKIIEKRLGSTLKDSDKELFSIE